MTAFELQVHQNPYLPQGAAELDAVLSVSARAEAVDEHQPEAVEVFLIDCSGSMNEPPEKMQAALDATGRAIGHLREGTWFAVVAGSTSARVVYPEAFPPRLARATPASQELAQRAVRRLHPAGSTAMSTWLARARELFESRPSSIGHALLLTDGRNEGEAPEALLAELQRCAGLFQCDCRGIGTDWDSRELLGISDALLGTTDIIPAIDDLDQELERIVRQSMARRLGRVSLHFLTPVGAELVALRQVSPELLEMSSMATWMQPDARSGEWLTVTSIDPGRPVMSLFPTGAWSPGEQREYHLRLRVQPQEVGEHNELRAARVSLVLDTATVAQAPVRAIWTAAEDTRTRIDRRVAHYAAQEELARAIEEGMEAYRGGDTDRATQRLGRALELAEASHHDDTKRLLKAIVEVDEDDGGTVRLKREVRREDEMMLDTRSRRTVRLDRRDQEG